MDTVRDDDGTRTVDDAADGAAYAAQEKEAVTFQRFNLHAAVSLRADDDVGRERLCRYLTRPAVAVAPGAPCRRHPSPSPKEVSADTPKTVPDT